MGRQALFAAVCVLTLSQTCGDNRQYLAVQDNDSAESAPRLYRNVNLGMYAGGVPHVPVSYRYQTFGPAVKTAASQTIPVRENFVNHLTDSYGNKFVGASPISGYKLAFPQQFVSLPSKLPAHLSQPLVAASANFQFQQQSNGQFHGSPYKITALQNPTPLQNFPTFGQLYGNTVKNFAPNSVIYTHGFGIPNAQQQSSNNKAVFSNTQSQKQFANLIKVPKLTKAKDSEVIIGKPKVKNVQPITTESSEEETYQKIKEAPRTHYNDAKFQRLQATPDPDLSEPTSQQQTSQESEESYTLGQELPHYESKFQIIEDKPQKEQLPYGVQIKHTGHSREKPKHTKNEFKSQTSHSSKVKAPTAPTKQTFTYINDIDGKKTIVELDSTPKLPLLDISLLEPLTFSNPLVPQVQHYLPRINQAKYHKLPTANLPSVKNYQKEYVVQKSSSYDSAEVPEKSHKETSKKKHKKTTQPDKYSKKNESPKNTQVTYHGTLQHAPEIVYEINAPNYKETIKEQAVSYNKQINSEPIHYTYGTNSEKDPVTYSYSRTSSEPIKIQTVQYHGNGPHLIYNFKPEEHVYVDKSDKSPVHQSEQDNNHKSNDDGSSYHQHSSAEQYKGHTQPSAEQHNSSYEEKGNTHKEDEKHQVIHDSPPKYFSEPIQFTSENINFQPILKEYENNIRLLTAPSASIKVDPHQHVQQATSTPQPQVNHLEEHSQSQHQRPNPSPAPQEYSSAETPKHEYSATPTTNTYNAPTPHIHEKSKHIIIHDEAPEETHMLREQMREKEVNQEENSEEDFEKAYQDSALGFPAYNQKTSDSEKDIFDPESYGVPRDHEEYDFENTPFQQYQEAGDAFPKETRSRYKDARDKMKQNYYSDFSISKPESLLDRYQNKLGYYKLFKEQKPDYLIVNEDDNNKKQQKSAQYTAVPLSDFFSSQESGKSYNGHAAPKQHLYEYDYSKGIPRDSSAFASGPYQSYKRTLSFAEPQFEYGFEPVSIPKGFQSELAAMASNVSPESKNPTMRKKMYKENWYIKKTSTSGGAPAS